MKPTRIFAFVCLLLALSPLGAAEEKIGVRPYEMDWAGRTDEVRPALVSFETFGDWTVETENAAANFVQSREEQMFGQYVAKLVYRSADEKNAKPPVVKILRQEPLPLPAGIDTATLWIEGNNWAWAPDPKTPQVLVSLIFKTADGVEQTLPLDRVRWNEWFFCYKKLPPTMIAALEKPGAVFCGFRIDGGRNIEDRNLYFDSLCVFKEELPPLEFTPRPKRGIAMFPNQPLGPNTGEGKLPFPTREETILPVNLTAKFKNSVVQKEDGAFELTYEGEDGQLRFVYKPESGSWSDWTAQWNDGPVFHPLSGGGITELVFEEGFTPQGQRKETVEPVKTFQPMEIKLDGQEVVARWKLTSDHVEATVTYRFTLWGKSLIIDTLSAGGSVAQIPFGRVEKIARPETIPIPYYTYGYTARPAAVLFDNAKDAGGTKADSAEKISEPLFILGNIDWYRSNSSYLRGRSEVGNDYAVFSGGAEYHPVWRGKRNDVFERYFVTASPRFEEILPTIDNPVSPWKKVTGNGVWRSHGASVRENDKAFWRRVWRHGMRHIIITDHEVCWRDGGESFTFRTKPAPKKGGDAGWIDYSDFLQKTLGFVYGPYNNFTDFAPVNEYWSPDMISRTEEGQLQEAWARCYAPKPLRAVEYCEKLSPINEAKFHFSTAYCDVHSSVTPWSRTDYDPRIPGAGTFAAVYYPYGEIMLLQKKAWGGPVYSEGPHHAFYAGLTDGNYAQDQAYRLLTNPWLVDFDLLKIHPLECDFGMGNIGMFAPGYYPTNDTERENLLDRFLTATVAFGHPGFFACDYGMKSAMKSYFMIQQIASRYTQADVASIRYADETGNLFTTSEAISTGVFRGNRLVVRYQDGTTVFANGNPTEPMTVEGEGQKIKLPPNGYEAWTKDGAIHVVSKLGENGRRFDYSESPDYVYLDGRGTISAQPKAFGAGCGVCRTLEDGRFEVIPLDGARLGFKIDANSAVALDEAGKELGETPVTFSRGYVFVEPVNGAFSYRLETGEKSAVDSEKTGHRLDSDRLRVIAGETVSVTDSTDPTKKWDVTIPADATPGLWTAEPTDGGKIDFDVVPLADVAVSFDANRRPILRLFGVLPNFPEITVTANLGEKSILEKKVELADGRGEIPLDFGEPVEGTKRLTISMTAKDVSQKVEKTVKTAPDFLRYPADFGDREDSAPNRFTPWLEVRGRERSQDFAPSGSYLYKSAGSICGGVKKAGLDVHPPYKQGAGRIYMEYRLTLPVADSLVLTAQVGKRDGSDVGDGIYYSVAVVGEDGSETVVGEKAVTTFGWQELSADLTPFAGKTVTLRLITDCGPKDNTAADWGVWSKMELQSREKALISTVE